MIIIFDCRGPIYHYHHVVSPQTTINAAYYRNVLQQLLRHICQKHPHFRKIWILHHDNARSHTMRLVQDWLARCLIEVMPHLSRSPDLALCNFWLFSVLKKVIPGRHFQNNEEVMNAVHTLCAILVEEFATTIKEKW